MNGKLSLIYSPMSPPSLQIFRFDSRIFKYMRKKRRKNKRHSNKKINFKKLQTRYMLCKKVPNFVFKCVFFLLIYMFVNSIDIYYLDVATDFHIL